ILSKNRDSKALGQYFKGRIALAKGQIAEAIPLLQRAIKEAPRLALAHYYLGQAYLKDQKLEQAKLHFKKASQIAPNLAEPHILLAELALRSQAPDQAIASAQNVLKFHAENEIAYRLLGQVFMAKGETAKALAVLKSATEHRPQEATRDFSLG